MNYFTNPSKFTLRNDFLKIGTPLFGLARVYENNINSFEIE